MKKYVYPFLCGLILLGGLLSSCGKESKVAIYHFYCNTSEFTQPAEITDPGMQDAYTQFLTDYMSDLLKLKLEETCQVDITGGKFTDEDTRNLAKYNSHLLELKKLESFYRKRLAEFGNQGSASFRIKTVYSLSRSVPADYAPAVTLQEYTFELKYN